MRYLSFVLLLISLTVASVSDSIIWVQQNKGTRTLWGVHFVDTLNGYAYGNGGIIYKTGNGGSSWSISTFVSSDTIYGMHFVNCSTGYLCTGSGRIYKTSDTARTWIQNYYRSGWLTGIYFWNRDTGWAVGAARRLPYSTYGAVIYRTRNGGNSWDSTAVTGPYALRTVHTLDGINLYSCGYNYLVKSGSSGSTWNGAVSFMGIADAQFQGSNGYVNNAAFVSATNGLAVGRYGHIIRTDNGGVSWGSARINDYSWLEDVKYADSVRAVVVGERGVVLSTADGGISWTKRFPRHSSSLNGPWYRAICVVDPNNMWMVGDSGLIMKGRFYNPPTVAFGSTTFLKIGSNYSQLKAVYLGNRSIMLSYVAKPVSSLQFSISNLLGQRITLLQNVYTTESGNGSLTIPFNTNSSGVFVVKMESSGGVVCSARLIIIQ